MKEPKRYYCGNGEGMFEDDKNGHWVEYSEHKSIVEALTEHLRKHDIVGQSEQLKCDCGETEDVKLIPICKDCYNNGEF
jgi:hypothetical protein